MICSYGRVLLPHEGMRSFLHAGNFRMQYIHHRLFATVANQTLEYKTVLSKITGDGNLTNKLQKVILGDTR